MVLFLLVLRYTSKQYLISDLFEVESPTDCDF